MYFVNFFVVADQNQQITDQNSNIGEIKRWLGVDKVYSLKQNYRNSNPIAQLAQHFYTDPATEKPELPEFIKTPFARPQLCDYADHEKIIKGILKKSDQDPSLLVGIFTCLNKTREKYLDALNDCNIKLDNNKPSISTYYSNGNSAVNIDFHRGGIVVLNDRSAKGLEFDIVFIADIDDFNVIRNKDEMKKRFYVMTSRAIKQIVLLRNSEKTKEYRVDDILPKDESILNRQNIP
jgi:superfamily I DNA/RNA helicase